MKQATYGRDKNGKKVTDKSEIWKLQQGDKVYYVRIDKYGNAVRDPKHAGAKAPHYHVDSCDSTQPATNPVRDAKGAPQKNPDGTWQTTTDKSKSQDKHYEQEWEPSAVNYDRNGQPVHPADPNWAERTHLTAG